VSEGVEDGLSVVMAKPNLRVIAAVSLNNIRNLVLPADCPLYILGQRDEELQAIDSFEKAVVAHQQSGREVYLIDPPEGYKDYNEPIDRRGS